jgi:hypothetical protein
MRQTHANQKRRRRAERRAERKRARALGQHIDVDTLRHQRSDADRERTLRHQHPALRRLS